MTDTEQSILELARKRFERFGFRKTTIDEICRDGGISKKTVYRHFRDKENYWGGFWSRRPVRPARRSFGAWGAVSDPPKKLEKLIRIAVEFFQEERFITRLLKDEEGISLSSSLSSHVERAESAAIRMVAEILQDGIDQGRFREVDPRVTSYALLKLFQAFHLRALGVPAASQKESSPGNPDDGRLRTAGSGDARILERPESANRREDRRGGPWRTKDCDRVSSPDRELKQSRVMEIAPDIWMIEGYLSTNFFFKPPSCNCFILRDGDLVLLIDTGAYCHYRDKMLTILERYRRDGAKRLVLMLTQGHFDHVGNNDVIREAGYSEALSLSSSPRRRCRPSICSRTGRTSTASFASTTTPIVR